MNGDVFLATTALTEFWDTGSRILFLGEQCRPFSRRDIWGKLDADMAPFCWDEESAVLEANAFCWELHGRALAALTPLLNDLHGLDRDTHYYRILFGRWLQEFIHQLYDKYRHLEAAFAAHGSLRSMALDEGQFVIPVDWPDFHRKLADDRYALQIYSQLLRTMGHDVPARRSENPLLQGRSIRLYTGAGDRMVRGIYGCLGALQHRLYGRRFLIVQPQFAYRNLMQSVRLLMRTRLQATIDTFRYPLSADFEVDPGRRRGWDLRLGEEPFARALATLLPLHLPCHYLEAFPQILPQIRAIPARDLHAVFSTGLHFDGLLMHFLAEHHRRIHILIAQHGSHYGFAKTFAREQIELATCDVFYTWGYRRCERERPLPAPRMSLHRRTRHDHRIERVLLSTNQAHRYINDLTHFFHVRHMLRENLPHIIMFHKLISPHMHLLIRNVPEGPDSLDLEGRLKEAGVRDCFDDHSLTFLQRLIRCDLLASDHLSTTAMEAMAMNVPTIVFFNPERYLLNDDMRGRLLAMERAGIFHREAQAAAGHLLQIRESPAAWWLADRTQAAREDFVRHHAMVSKDWASEWAREFRRVAGVPPPRRQASDPG